MKTFEFEGVKYSYIHTHRLTYVRNEEENIGMFCAKGLLDSQDLHQLIRIYNWGYVQGLKDTLEKIQLSYGEQK